MIRRFTRPVAALLLLVGGIVHYDLWTKGYRHIPHIGPLFLANFVGSLALAAAVVRRRRFAVDMVGIAFAAGSLSALVLSRTVGFFGFTEFAWTPLAVKTVLAEVGVILALGIAVITHIRDAHDLDRPQVAPSASRA